MKLAILVVLPLLFSLATNISSAQDTTNTTNSKWAGRWQRAIWQNNALLEIKDVGNDSLSFSLTANSGAHEGELEGKAYINDSIAVYYAAGETDTCLLKFTLYGDSLIMVDEEKYCLKTIGVAYKGRYVNSDYSHQDDDEPKNFVDLGILTPLQDSLLQLLTANSYRAFFNSTELTDTSTDIDGLHARVCASGIRGLYTYMENIIMVDANNNIWAAVIDVDKVLYFTNTSNFIATLPKTIEKWRQNFKNLPVMYRSKK